jgi:hypothetical protein
MGRRAHPDSTNSSNFDLRNSRSSSPARGQPYGGNNGSNGGNSSSNGGNNSSSLKNQGGEASWPSFNRWTGSIQVWSGSGGFGQQPQRPP